MAEKGAFVLFDCGLLDTKGHNGFLLRLTCRVVVCLRPRRRPVVRRRPGKTFPHTWLKRGQGMGRMIPAIVRVGSCV